MLLEYGEVWERVERRLSIKGLLHRGADAKEGYSSARLPIGYGVCWLAVYLMCSLLCLPDLLHHPSTA